MTSLVHVCRWLTTAFVAVVVAAGSVQAQYPYWATAPQSYSGSRVSIPVPGMSPNTISNASQSPPSPTSMGGSIGGGYVPPSLTARDIALPQRERTDMYNKAHIWLRVPADAEIWVNGVKTKQTGESRYFFSPPLTPGKKYSYQMRVLWKKDGKPVEETQRILVQAGATIRRDFTRSSEKSELRP